MKWWMYVIWAALMCFLWYRAWMDIREMLIARLMKEIDKWLRDVSNPPKVTIGVKYTMTFPARNFAVMNGFPGYITLPRPSEEPILTFNIKEIPREKWGMYLLKDIRRFYGKETLGEIIMDSRALKEIEIAKEQYFLKHGVRIQPDFDYRIEVVP